MKLLSRIGKRIIGVLLALFVILMVFAAAFKVYVGNYYTADEAVAKEFQDKASGNVAAYQSNEGEVFLPRNQDYKAVIVFYPGGKVEFKAYSGLMYELADRGYICLLPRMPENLAFLRINAMDVLTGKYREQVETVKHLDWYLAGHSLGGVAASKYLESTEHDFAGIIFCASYPTVDLSGSDYRLLSIYGSEDKVLNMENYENSKVLWPSDSEEYVIQGGIHSYFGNYGIQEGDGEPSITNEQQILEAADVISTFCAD